MEQIAERAAILGCGYVGRQVSQYWKQSGLTVTATTTTPTKVPDIETIAHSAVVVRGNDASELQRLLANQDVILVSVGGNRQQHYRETYFETAQTLAMVLPNTSVRQVIYTSSFSVYGNHCGHWVTEETAIAPTTDRTQALADTEHCLLNAATRDRSVCILRLGGIYGPGRELLKIFHRRSGTTIDGDGKNPSNWVHLDDIVGAIDFARQHRLNGLYNVVQDTILSRRDLLDRLFQSYHLPSVQWNPEVFIEGAHCVKVSNQKLKDEGYQFAHTDFWMPPESTFSSPVKPQKL